MKLDKNRSKNQEQRQDQHHGERQCGPRSVEQIQDHGQSNRRDSQDTKGFLGVYLVGKGGLTGKVLV